VSGAPAVPGPNPLTVHYSRFRVAERLLLTGHSHQAWPDVGFEGQMEAWNDAAERVDDKWPLAFAKADRVRRGFAALLRAAPEEIALGVSTYELVTRFLSALDLEKRPRLVSTDAEFHTLRRLLDRLSETRSLEIVKVAAEPVETLAERLASQVNDRTSAALVSSVLFVTSRIVPGLSALAEACRRAGAELLLDAYHQVNVAPLSLGSDGLEDAFVVGGGYKYCQLGEGNCFLRVPPGREAMRPALTGWYAEYGGLSSTRRDGVTYAEGPLRWAGSTYDPTSHYRAARVFDFFETRGLDAERLRQISQRQVGLLAQSFDALSLDPTSIERPTVPLESLGGFLSLHSTRAGEMCERLKARGVSADHRGEWLRLGPAPYLSDRQLTDAIGILGEIVREP